jgi:hypothetical protein
MDIFDADQQKPTAVVGKRRNILRELLLRQPPLGGFPLLVAPART